MTLSTAQSIMINRKCNPSFPGYQSEDCPHHSRSSLLWPGSGPLEVCMGIERPLPHLSGGLGDSLHYQDSLSNFCFQKNISLNWLFKSTRTSRLKTYTRKRLIMMKGTEIELGCFHLFVPTYETVGQKVTSCVKRNAPQARGQLPSLSESLAFMLIPAHKIHTM